MSLPYSVVSTAQKDLKKAVDFEYADLIQI